jgi:signal recognition particle subunit SEC65
MNDERNLLTETSNLLGELEPVLRKGIDSLQHDLTPQTGMLKQLIQEEIEKYEVLLTRIQETTQQIDVFLNPDPDIIRSEGPLCVTMPNGEQIHLSTGADTFVEVIEKLEIEQVRRLGLKIGRYQLVSPYDDYPNSTRRSGNYWIITNTSTKQKKRLLEKIAERLRVSLKVEIIEN